MLTIKIATNKLLKILSQAGEKTLEICFKEASSCQLYRLEYFKAAVLRGMRFKMKCHRIVNNSYVGHLPGAVSPGEKRAGWPLAWAGVKEGLPFTWGALMRSRDAALNSPSQRGWGKNQVKRQVTEQICPERQTGWSNGVMNSKRTFT